MQLPRELDFAADAAASPERMNRAMAFLVAWLRRVEAVQPEFQSTIDLLRQSGLERIAEGIVPVYAEAVEIRDTLQAIRTIWENDLLPQQLRDDVIAAVLALVYQRGDVDAALAQLAESTYDRETADDRFARATAVTPRLIPSGGAQLQVLSKTGPEDFDFAWTGLPSLAWQEIAALDLAGTGKPTFSNISPAFYELQLRIENVRPQSPGLCLQLSADGITWSGSRSVHNNGLSSNDYHFGSLALPGFAKDFCAISGAVGTIAAVGGIQFERASVSFGVRCTGGIAALRFTSADGVDLTATGRIVLLGR